MDSKMSVSGVTYQEAGHDYFNKRALTRHAGAWSLWALGVAAVISGDFSGWNFGIGEAGWGGMLVATIIIGLMYLLMIFSISEMSATMPHTGGAYSFGRSAMGPWGGFVTGLAETIEYVITTAVVGTFSGLYADAITDDLFGFTMPLWAWVTVFYIIFVGSQALSVRPPPSGLRSSSRCCPWQSWRSSSCSRSSRANSPSTTSLTSPQTRATARSFPSGSAASWLLFRSRSGSSLGSRSSRSRPKRRRLRRRTFPAGRLAGMLTLLVTAFLVLILNPGSSGSEAMSDSGEPILDGFRVIFPNSSIAALLALFALTGLIASFQGIMFAAGRNMYSLSRAGYYPQFLSLTGRRQVPYVALIVSAVVGIGLVFGLTIVQDSDGGTAATKLLNVAVFGAVIAYFLQMVAYLLLRARMGDVERPYRSPVGVIGALVAAIIAGVTLVILPFNDDYRSVVVAVAVFFAIGIVWFALVGRHKLVLSPEEEFAVTRGKHGHPETEGYDVTESEMLGDGTAPPG